MSFRVPCESGKSYTPYPFYPKVEMRQLTGVRPLITMEELRFTLDGRIPHEHHRMLPEGCSVECSCCGKMVGIVYEWRCLSVCVNCVVEAVHP